ncbi:thiosulfate sulfurtransferase (rhodanese)-like domain-containing protein 2 [Lunasporangiospora selenospora]|uniref:Thiosulfate sulfurtransferase (Rhodanese)-like domain-containing protein 2 n=1 Tax=Lunasporangiospora selenospora TaxID=979761 RepID=A0A9P6G3D6_9FUNG|nr:thiosulfate sulfurtransferase (rhodanese)-like domain-containing protein 2 [Lunasporangiospora selenospora]
MTLPAQTRIARNKALGELLHERRTGNDKWACCSSDFQNSASVFRHLATSHPDLVDCLTQDILSQLHPKSKHSNGSTSLDRELSDSAEFTSRRAKKYESDPVSLSCSCGTGAETVILFYAYIAIDDPLDLAKRHKSWASELGLYGKVRIANEGINATLSGSDSSIHAYINLLTDFSPFKSLQLSQVKDSSSEDEKRSLERKRFAFFKPSSGCRHVFGGVMSIKAVDEICPLGAPELSVSQDQRNKTGKLPPKEFHDKLLATSARSDVVVLDVRNYYESDIGQFKNAITPPIRKFSSFKDYVDRNKENLSGKTILSYCTGGIRCEKATTYMRKALDPLDVAKKTEVLMLEGGIHNYLEWIKQEGKADESLWLGKNYVFDARQSLGLDDSATSGASLGDSSDRLISTCRGCHTPCARYVKCSGFGCHRLIIACLICSPAENTKEEIGMCCCSECQDMGKKLQAYAHSGEKAGSITSNTLVPLSHPNILNASPLACKATVLLVPDFSTASPVHSPPSVSNTPNQHQPCADTAIAPSGILQRLSSRNWLDLRANGLFIIPKHIMSSNTSDSQWLFKKEDLYRTPSQASGMSYQTEKESRRKGVGFIIADIGATCVYLASKTEESTRKFKDVIVACAQKAAKKETPIDDQSKEYRLWKDTIIYTEETLLETLCFELSVEHPYPFMLWFFNKHYTSDVHRARKLKNVAWAFINDSLRTTLCLMYQPKAIALAAILLAAKYLDENLNDTLGDVWRELYEPDSQEINEAANEIMDQYTQLTRSSRSLEKMLPGSKPGSEYQENNTPSYGGYLNSPAKLATPVYSHDTERPTNVTE